MRGSVCGRPIVTMSLRQPMDGRGWLLPLEIGEKINETDLKGKRLEEMNESDLECCC